MKKVKITGKSPAHNIQKIKSERAKNFRKNHMKLLREMKKELEKAEKAQEKAAEIQRELLEAHTKATRDMHRSILGKDPKKKK